LIKAYAVDSADYYIIIDSILIKIVLKDTLIFIKEDYDMTKKTNRRNFMKLAATAGGVFAGMHATGKYAFGTETPVQAAAKPPAASPAAVTADMKSKFIPLTELPYPTRALQPYLSERTVYEHYHNHHMNYYNRVTGYIKSNPEYDNITLDDLLLKTKEGILLEAAIYNMGILLWNHNFYWPSMKPKGGIKSAAQSALTKKIAETFGSVDKFKQKFMEKSLDIDVGWVWLVKNPEGKLEVLRTDYHDGPIMAKYVPLITIDVWEHAYYMDYGHDRQMYVDNYLNNLVNWDFAEANFKLPPKKVAPEKAAAPEKKPEPEKAAVPEKKAEPAAKPVPEKKTEPEKKPVPEKKPE